MRVALINPPVVFTNRIAPVIKSLFYNSPPLGLGYLGAYIESLGHRALLIDAAVENLSHQSIVERLREFEPELIGLTSTTVSIKSTISLARTLKHTFDRPIVVGGPHISASPLETLAEPVFDYGVIGEGELTLAELIEVIKGNRSPEDVLGLCYRSNGEVVVNPRRPAIENLDTLPHPLRRDFPLLKYRPQPNDEYRLPKTSMITSRGCPYSCIFCDKAVFGKAYRYHSAGYVADEIEQLLQDYHIKDIAFVDSTFFPTRKKIWQLLNEIKKRKLRFSWTCSVRANIVTRELLKAMKYAGCWRVRFGVESGNDYVLNQLRKGINKEQVQRAVSWAEEVGLQPKGFFMVGHLFDTPETIQESIEFACQLPLKDVTVQINTPMKGTEQFEKAIEYGTMVARDSVELSFWQPVFVPHGLTEEELLKWRNRFYRSFYCRPSTLYRHLRYLHRPSDLRKYLRALELLWHLFFGKA